MKKWYLSKTLIVNTIAFIAMFVQAVTGKEMISVEAQGMILTFINIIVRLITKSELTL